ncbi:helix-turn-helix domain-containing protein [Nakamurella sp. YIM 132087]|uniref:DNA-3-methyladenine glycosylase II n=1 Tax=Nakamurella alba TaxID=2665158 RepID=A0A7K1FHX2_9ACTN|nr:AlkA N-terminal domain-containing protein [Nakamurella alba]MTD12883.1 helix-turn-helix domain-containing protein [Nakamurella alba]
MFTDPDVAYRAVMSRDTRFDGQFVTAVRTTRIYCRPGCPARTPLRHNVTFYPTAAAAQTAGYRACRRCLPDAAPGSPEWNLRADTVGAAMRLIDDGVVDREGIPGLAGRLGYSARHLGRLLTEEVGAPPLRLARARRANTARILLTTTDLPMSDIAFAAGFSSIRQFNETVQEVYDTDPTTLRARKRPETTGESGSLTLRLAVRAPFDTDRLLWFLAKEHVPGVETVLGRVYSRSLRLPAGAGVVRLELPDPGAPPVVRATLHLEQLSDLVPAVERCRRLLDADADPQAVDEVLGADPLLAASVRERPGVRVPGSVDGPEMLVRALFGQQISLAAARAALGKLTVRAGRELPETLRGAAHGITHLFPAPADLAALTPEDIPGPGRRARTVIHTSGLIAAGDLVIDTGCRTEELVPALVALPGLGPWTANLMAMRLLRDPDVLLGGDLVMQRGAIALGLPDRPPALLAHAEQWRPFRSYAGLHLWLAAIEGVPA